MIKKMYAAGDTPNTFSYNSVLFKMAKDAKRYGREGKELMEEMKGRGVEPNVATYNAMMNIRSKRGEVEECFALFEEMKGRGLVPDVYSYNLLMDIRGRQRDESGVNSILNSLVTSNTAPTRASLNILLRVISDRGDTASCQQVLAQIKKQFGAANVFGYNCVLECMARKGDAEGCKEILEEMHQIGIDPDSATLNTILRYFPAPCALHAMVQRAQRNARTYNLLLGSAVTQRDADTIVSLLKEMKQREVKPDSNTYSMILKAIIAFKDVPVGTVVGDLCTMAGRLAELNQAIRSMREEGVLPDVVSYQILITEAAENGDIKSCQDLIEEMTQHGVQMDVKFYTTIIDKLAKRGYWKEAKMIFSEIQTAGVALDAMVYDVMLTNTAKNGSYLDCVSLFGKMREKNLYSAHSFTTMVNAAAANKRWSECYTFLDAMRAHHFVPDARAYTSLMSHVLACGNLREYQSLFASVRDTNVGDQTLYYAMHNGLHALLAQKDKFKHIHQQVLDELQILQNEMSSRGFNLPQINKNNKQEKERGKDQEKERRMVSTHVHIPPQSVQNMLNCL